MNANATDSPTALRGILAEMRDPVAAVLRKPAPARSETDYELVRAWNSLKARMAYAGWRDAAPTLGFGHLLKRRRGGRPQ